jgi:hypothetical protein
VLGNISPRLSHTEAFIQNHRTVETALTIRLVFVENPDLATFRSSPLTSTVFSVGLSPNCLPRNSLLIASSPSVD